MEERRHAVSPLRDLVDYLTASKLPIVMLSEKSA